MSEERKPKLATPKQQEDGWTLSLELLNEIQAKLIDYDCTPSWEFIELVLLAYHDMELPEEERNQS